jgi:uncharacterized protein
VYVGGKRKLPKRRRTTFRTIALISCVPIAGLLVFLGWRWLKQPRVAPSAPAAPRVSAKKEPPPRSAAPRKADRTTRIVLILDDVGFDHQPLDTAMQIDPNLNFSILPNAARADEFARRLHARGFEVLCHLPMEPIDYPRESPGPNAILMSMSNEEIARTTREDVATIPHARGVNNHMGSRATRDRRVMKSVLGSLPKGLYFIDSRTGPGSVAEAVARELNIPTSARDVFLDDVQEETAVRKQLQELVTVATARGSAIGIGHIYPVTVKVLKEEMPHLRARGVRLVRASTIVD